MTFLVLVEDFLRSLILLVNHLQHLVVHYLGGGLRVWLLEVVFVVVIETDVWQFLTHSGIGYHAVNTLGDTLKVVHRTGGDLSYKELLGSSAA